MRRFAQGVAIVLGIVAFASLPEFLSRTWQTHLVVAGMFAILALGLNVVVGFAGLLDLGYVAFWAIGSYSAAISLGAAPVHPFPWDLSVWATFPVALVFGMLAGVLLGFPVLRLRGDYLAIVTLGFGEIVRIMAENLEGITRGARGLGNIPAPVLPNPFGENYAFAANPRPYLYLVIVIMTVLIVAVWRIYESKIGRAWIAIREDEVAAEAMGVDTLKMKLLAFGIGAGIASFAGVVQATFAQFTSPGSFSVDISITVLAMVVLGGMGNIAGAITGAMAIILIPEVMRDPHLVGESIARQAEEYRILAFGALLVAMMIFRPQGIIPSRRRARELIHASSEEAAGAIPTEMERKDI